MEEIPHNIILDGRVRLTSLNLLLYIFELLTHFGSNPPIHMLVVYKLSWKVKKMCMKMNKRVPSASVPQRNAFAFERSCCSTQHPAVCFFVVMTVLDDSFRLGRQRKKATWILPCSKSRLLNTLLLLVSSASGSSDCSR